MSENTIKVARNRTTPYTVNYITANGMKTYQWIGSKGEKVDIKSIPSEVVDWLAMNSRSFSEGELAIIDDSPEVQEIIDNIEDKEILKENTHSFAEIKQILEGNFNKMKKELEKITINEEKRFVIEVAKQINLDSASKRDYLATFVGVPADILFTTKED